MNCVPMPERDDLPWFVASACLSDSEDEDEDRVFLNPG